MTNPIAKLSLETRAKIRAHAERGDLHGALSLLDCDGIIELLNERNEMRRRLRFIWLHAFTALQTAWGPLDELRAKLLQEIKNACHGNLPEWWADEIDPKDVAGLEPEQ